MLTPKHPQPETMPYMRLLGDNLRRTAETTPLCWSVYTCTHTHSHTQTHTHTHAHTHTTTHTQHTHPHTHTNTHTDTTPTLPPPTPGFQSYFWFSNKAKQSHRISPKKILITQ